MQNKKNKVKKYLCFLLVQQLMLICLVLRSPEIKATDINAAKQNNRPNIVFILVDDLGWGELGSYGNTFNETPNLDRLASAGKRFTQAYAAAPVCSPTRASIMTGQYPARVGITDFLPGGWRTNRFLDPQAYTTLNEALTEKGYHTGIVGKWHLDTRFNIHTGSPVAHGFHEVIGSETKYIAGGDYFFPYDKIETYTEGSPEEYLTDRQNQDACNFIRRNKDKPFFLYLSYYSVHTRLEAPKQTVDKYKKKFDQKYGAGSADRLFEVNKWHEAKHLDNPYLAAMLEHIDNGVGMIMQTLKDNGLAGNTLVVFTSDNGGADKVANNGELRSYKTWLYEGGIRVPLLVHWPNQIQAGEAKEAVSSIDFYPTLVSAAGGNVSQYSLDGENLLPLLQGQSLKERNLYWHYPSETAKWPERMSSVIRQGDYKLIRFYADDRYELYNLAKDPSETTNLASREPDRVRELSVLMENWKKEVNAEEPDLSAVRDDKSAAGIQAKKRTEELTKSLGLTADQSRRIQETFLTFFKKNEEIQKAQMSPAEKKQAQQNNMSQRREKLLEILTSQQWKKLQELRKQESENPITSITQDDKSPAGIQAKKRAEELTKSLDLTADQSRQIQETFLTFFKKNEEIQKAQMSPAEKKQARQNNMSQRREKLLEILTSQQWKKLQELRKEEDAKNKK